jgi:hypothetical protein
MIRLRSRVIADKTKELSIKQKDKEGTATQMTVNSSEGFKTWYRKTAA